MTRLRCDPSIGNFASTENKIAVQAIKRGPCRTTCTVVGEARKGWQHRCSYVFVGLRFWDLGFRAFAFIHCARKPIQNSITKAQLVEIFARCELRTEIQAEPKLYSNIDSTKHVHTYIYIYMHICIYRERERVLECCENHQPRTIALVCCSSFLSMDVEVVSFCRRRCRRRCSI